MVRVPLLHEARHPLLALPEHPVEVADRVLERRDGRIRLARADVGFRLGFPEREDALEHG
eukprot:1887263-Prymnesium_polylepis.1